MKKVLIHFMKLFLPLLFISYWGGITLFTHSHVVNGVVIVHSHPFKGLHHTETQLETIFFLSAFTTSDVTPVVYAAIVPMLLAILLVPKWEQVRKIAVRDGIHLRAPPYRIV